MIKGSNVIRSLSVIDNEIKKFLKQIAIDCDVDNGMYFKTEIDPQFFKYKILIHNTTTNQTAGKAWDLKQFLDMCAAKKIELEINTVARQLILKSSDRSVEEIIWI